MDDQTTPVVDPADDAVVPAADGDDAATDDTAAPVAVPTAVPADGDDAVDGEEEAAPAADESAAL